MRRLLSLLLVCLLAAALLHAAPAPAEQVTARGDSVPFPSAWRASEVPQLRQLVLTAREKAEAEARWNAAAKADAEARWYATVAWNAAVAAEAQRVQQESRRSSHPSAPARTSRSSTQSQGTGRCGGDLPPCSVMMCESGGNPTARNASGASGLWQIMPGTWGNYKGYPSAASAPVEVQNERAAQIWNGGAGARNWVCK